MSYELKLSDWLRRNGRKSVRDAIGEVQPACVMDEIIAWKFRLEWVDKHTIRLLPTIHGFQSLDYVTVNYADMLERIKKNNGNKPACLSELSDMVREAGGCVKWKDGRV